MSEVTNKNVDEKPGGAQAPPGGGAAFRVWPRSGYLKAKTPEGCETIVTAVDALIHERNAKRIMDVNLLVRRFSTCGLKYPNGRFVGMDNAAKGIASENAKGHVLAGAKGIKELFGSGKGKIAVVCGAGRSLLKDVPTLVNRDRDRVKVFAINGALRAFPPGSVDYFFALDWSAVEKWWKDYPRGDVDLVTCPATPPAIQGGWRNRYYFGGALKVEAGEEDKVWGEMGHLEVGLHATYSVMHLCYQMGFERVVLTGHDYALTDMWYHWDARATAQFGTEQRFKMVEDIRGDATMTGFKMERHARLINATMFFCEMDGMPCVNASMEGILASERQAPLGECLGKECPPMLVVPEEIPVHKGLEAEDFARKQMAEEKEAA